MIPPLRLIRRSLAAALLASALGAGFLACNAEVETRCFDGPCNEQDDTTASTTSATGSTTDSGTTTMCQPTKNGEDACSDDPQSGDFPCEVFTVLEAKCHNCHADPHGGGAPIDLLTCDRFHEQDCGPQRTRFRTADFYLFCTHYMPQGAKQLTDAEEQTLLDWITGCAPCVPAGTGCTGAPGTKACYED